MLSKIERWLINGTVAIHLRDAIGCLTSDLSLVSDWGRTNLVLFNASKTQFLQLSTRHNLLDNYLLFFNDTQLPLSSTLEHSVYPLLKILIGGIIG